MRGGTRIAAAAAGLIAAAAIAAPAAAEWRAGFQQGNDWASVKNAGEGAVRVYCSSRSDSPQASIWYDPGGGAGSGQQPPRAAFVVDGEEIAVDGHWQDGNFVYHLYSTQRFAEGTALIEALRKGRSLEMRLPGREAGETFTLAGSGDALDGIFDGCRR